MKQFIVDPASRLPAVISDAWLHTIPIVQVSTNSVHYRERELQNATNTLKAHMMRDEHVEEYKVSKNNTAAWRTQSILMVYAL